MGIIILAVGLGRMNVGPDQLKIVKRLLIGRVILSVLNGITRSVLADKLFKGSL